MDQLGDCRGVPHLPAGVVCGRNEWFSPPERIQEYPAGGPPRSGGNAGHPLQHSAVCQESAAALARHYQPREIQGLAILVVSQPRKVVSQVSHCPN